MFAIVGGWIKLYRQIVDWEFYTDTKTFKLWLHLLITCNIIPDKRAFGYTLQPGQLATTLPKLAAETGLSEKEVRSALEKLKKSGQITQKITNKFRIISVVNWAFYQGRQNGTDWADKTAPTGQTNDSPQTQKNQGETETSTDEAGRQRADKTSGAGQTPATHMGRRRIKNKELRIKKQNFLSASRADGGAPQGYQHPKNRFINYTQSEWDFEELERLQREQRKKWEPITEEELAARQFDRWKKQQREKLDAQFGNQLFGAWYREQQAAGRDFRQEEEYLYMTEEEIARTAYKKHIEELEEEKEPENE